MSRLLSLPPYQRPEHLKGTPLMYGPQRSSGDRRTEAKLTLPKGILPIKFSTIDLAASTTNVQLFRRVANAAGASGRAIGYVPPFKGSVVALSFVSDTSKTTGTASFKVFRTGVATLAVVTWTTSTTSGFKTFPVGVNPFMAGEKLDVRSTTSGFAPITSDVEVFMYLAQDVV